jgi:hypothetical protein
MREGSPSRAMSSRGVAGVKRAVFRAKVDTSGARNARPKGPDGGARRGEGSAGCAVYTVAGGVLRIFGRRVDNNGSREFVIGLACGGDVVSVGEECLEVKVWAPRDFWEGEVIERGKPLGHNWGETGPRRAGAFDFPTMIKFRWEPGAGVAREWMGVRTAPSTGGCRRLLLLPRY